MQKLLNSFLLSEEKENCRCCLCYTDTRNDGAPPGYTIFRDRVRAKEVCNGGVTCSLLKLDGG